MATAGHGKAPVGTHCSKEQASVKISLQFTLTPEDVAEYTSAHLKMARSIIPRRRYWIARAFPWITAALVGVGLFVLFQIGRDSSTDERDYIPNLVLSWLPWVMAVAVLCALLFRERLVRFIFRDLAKHRFKESSHVQQQQEVSISDSTLTWKSETAVSTCAWTHFIHLGESRNLFVLYVTFRLAQILPKRAFASQAQMDEFRAFALAHVGNEVVGFPVQLTGKSDASTDQTQRVQPRRDQT
jgi:hypothetical protein